jgi:hypothetical protein
VKVRRRNRLSLLVAALATVALAATPAFAFKLPQHEEIVRTSLAPAGVPPAVLDTVVGSLASGQGNLGSDRHQADAFRHFDNAPDPATVCARADEAWTRFYGEIRSSVRPGVVSDSTSAQGVEKARESFGALTHSVQDFYAHSNWIEIFLAQNVEPPLADTLFPSCDAGVLPEGLQTGFFAFELNNWAGCPASGPPAPYEYCHETLNKDDDSSIEGAKTAPPQGITYHQLAIQLAAAHTSELYRIVTTSLARDWASDFPEASVECLISQVFQDTKEPCGSTR